MRSVVTLALVLVVATLYSFGVASAQIDMPQLDQPKIGSKLAVDWVKEAADKAFYAGGSIKNSNYTQAEFQLRDGEFYLDIAVEFGVPADAACVKILRDEFAKCHTNLEEWGEGEPEKQVAEQWWQRIRWEHAKICDREVDPLIRAEEALDPEWCYWYPRYLARVILPEVAMFKEKYPDPEAFVELVPDTEGNQTSGNNPELRGKPWVEWCLALFGVVEEGLPGLVERSIPEALKLGKEQALILDDDPSDYSFALRALDYARIVLSLRSEDAMAEKIRNKAQAWLEGYQKKYGFNIEEVRMPTDVSPDDQPLHTELQGAYEAWAQAQGYDDTVLRVVVTGGWRESNDVWWVENTLHWGTFRRITAAVAVKKASGDCSILYCVFYRRLLQGGQWSPTRVDRIRTSTPILQANIAE